MEICLHLGAHRTGTTSLQLFMNDNRKAFYRDGTTYWGPGRTRAGLFSGLVRDPDRLTREDQRRAERSIGVIRMEMARAAQNGMERLVISEENMLGTLKQNFRSCRLYGQALQRLSRFAPAFEGHKLRIGIAIRSYDIYWSSALAFRIKQGHPLPSDELLDRLTTQPRRWRDVIEDAACAFPTAKISVWPFEAWAGQPDQHARCLTARMLPRDMRVRTAANNASLRASEIGAIARDRGQIAEADRLCPQIGRYSPLNKDQALKLRQDYTSDIDWLEQGGDGLVTYFRPTGETFGGPTNARGSYYDRQKRLGRARQRRIARTIAG